MQSFGKTMEKRAFQVEGIAGAEEQDHDKECRIGIGREVQSLTLFCGQWRKLLLDFGVCMHCVFMGQVGRVT